MSNVSRLEKARNLKGSKLGTYVSIGFSLYGAFGIAKQYRAAKNDRDALKLVDAVVRAAALVTGVTMLARELRAGYSDDILAG